MPRKEKTPTIIFFTQNTRFARRLAHLLEDYQVEQAENIEAVGKIVKKSNAVAVLFHVTSISGWIILEVLRTGFPNLPRFAVISPAVSLHESSDLTKLAKDRGVIAVADDDNFPTMTGLIEQTIRASRPVAPKPEYSFTNFRQTYTAVSEELLRLQKEWTVFSLRTLPQAEIGEDTLTRLENALDKLRAVKLEP